MGPDQHRRLTTLGSGRIDERFTNRELSWLDFNERVLALASDPELALLERAKFLAICSSNLDEFFQVRVAALKDQQAAGITATSPDGRTPAQQLLEIGDRVVELMHRQEDVLLGQVLPALRTAGIEILSLDALNDKERGIADDTFRERIFPVLTPLAVDPAHPFPYLSNLALSLAVMVRDPETGERRFARVKVPSIFPRLVAVGPGHDRFVLAEDLIAGNLDRLFHGMVVQHCSAFRVTRNADLTLEEEEADDLLAAVEMELRRRRFGRAVRLEVQEGIADVVLDLLLRELELDRDDVSFLAGPLDLTALFEIASLDRPELHDRPWTPLTAGRIAAAEEAERSIFSVIRDRDLLVHHPYEGFASSVEAFLEQAANDPRVQSIKVTLYRTSADSAIAQALVKAAERGVQVAALVELKARFDEATNVTWAKTLERAGVHVVYGLVGLKTHSKCILVVRNDTDGLRRYVHIGTGNYNSRTARLYEDLGYLTDDPDIGADATQLFNHLTGYSRDESYRRLVVAPRHMRRQLLELIAREAGHGPDGHIVVKVNSIADVEIIEALYSASAAGARIDLLVRGICCLRPGVEGMSEYIRVRSILGRYLEHSRVYRFANGGGPGVPRVLIGSADLMPRNLDRRVEVLVPIEHPRHVAWIDKVLEIDLADDVAAWELDGNDIAWRRIGTPDAAGDPQARLFAWVAEQQARRQPAAAF